MRTPGIVRRGARLLVRYVRAQPMPFLVSIVGASIYAGAAVGTTATMEAPRGMKSAA